MQLKVENISFRYNSSDRWIFENVDFTVEQGEVVGLVAPSGYGKTTLAKILASYIKPTLGRVILEGVKKDEYYPVQLIFQHPEKSVNPKWKMKDILTEGWNPPKTLLQSIGIEEGWLNRWPSELSGGELQRFCVVRTLSPATKFLIADEITTMLDAITQAQIWEVVINRAKEHNMGVIIISHDKDLLNRLCHRFVDLTTFHDKDK